MATTSLPYQNVFSAFLTKVEPYDLFDTNLPEGMLMKFLCSYLHSASSGSYFRRLFSTFILSDPEPLLADDAPSDDGSYYMDGIIDYEFKYSTNEDEDNAFVIDVLSEGMVYEWISPKTNSLETMKQFIGSNDEKWFSQSSHLAALQSLRDNTESRFRKLIRDRGSVYNDYIDGNAASASLRTSGVTS